MASFVPLPSGNNSAIGAAASAASAAASIYNSKQNRLQAAADQQATLKRQKTNDDQAFAQRGLQNDLEMARLGAVPQQTYSTGAPAAGRPTLKTPEDNPAAQGAGQTIANPQGGSPWYIPTDQEKGKSFVPAGQLGELLKTGGWDGKTPITEEQSHLLVQAVHEAAPKDEPFHIDTSGKFQDGQGKPAAVAIGDKTGKVRLLDLSGGGNSTNGASPFQTSEAQKQGPIAPGTLIGGGAPGGAFSFAPPEKAEKPDVSQMIPGQQGPNGGMLIYDKNDQSVREVPYPKGSKPVLNAAQTEADKDRHVRQSELEDARAARLSAADQVRENQAAKDHEAAGLKKESMQGMAQGFYDAAGTQPGETYFPPRYVNGIVVPGPATIMPADKAQAADRQKALKTSAQGFEKTAKTHQNEQERIEKQRGWGKFAPAGTPPPAVGKTTVKTAPAQPAQPAQPAAAPAAKPAAAAAAAGQKVQSLATVRAYAQKNGMSEADAIRTAKAEGYSIGQ